MQVKESKTTLKATLSLIDTTWFITSKYAFLCEAHLLSPAGLLSGTVDKGLRLPKPKAYHVHGPLVAVGPGPISRQLQ